MFNDNFFTYQTVRPQKQYRLDGANFIGMGNTTHELKFGFGYRDTPVRSASTYPGPASGFWSYAITGNSATLCSSLDLPANCAIAQLVRPPLQSYSGEYKELYLGDTVTFGNLTLQGGLRWDDQQSAIQAMEVGSNPVLSSPLELPCTASLGCANGRMSASLPGVNYPGQDRDLKWSSISPRLGATYALGADRRTLVRAAYNRYVSQMGSAVASSSPLANSFFTFYGVDANNDRTIQRNELMMVRSFSGINPANPTAVGGTRRIDYDMRPPKTDELLLGAERELMTNFSVGLTLTHRKNSDALAVRWEKTQGAGDYYTSADYVLAGRTAGGTFTLRDPATGNTLHTFTTGSVPLWALSPNVAPPVFSVITNRPDYEQTYNGLEMTATKRMSNNWMMRFNASYNNYSDDCGPGSFANPTPGLNSAGLVNGAAGYGGPAACPGGEVAPQSAGSGAFGNVFINSKWNANLNGAYQAPFGITLGANFMARQGYPAVLQETVTGLRGGAYTAVLSPIGEVRFPNVYQLDFRLAKDFRLFDLVTVGVAGEVFNATNERTVLQRNSLVMQNANSLASGWRITELQAPRVYRVGGRITF